MNAYIRTTPIYIRTKPKNKLIHRDRILNIIYSNLDKNFIFLHAAAGYGKSTILYQLTEEADTDVFYFCPEEDILSFAGFSENFYDFLAESLGTEGEGSFQELFCEMKANFSSILSHFLDMLLELHPAIICIDNFHAIKNEEALRLLDCLINHQSQKNTFICCSRKAVPDILSKQLLYNDGVYLGTDTLRFTESEAQNLFSHAAKSFSFDPDKLNRIIRKCNGWPVALSYYFQKLSEQTYAFGTLRPDEDNLLFNYIKYEIFEKLNQDVQDFLLSTGFLSNFTPKLCSCVAGLNTPENILFYLEKNQVFLNKVWDPCLLDKECAENTITYQYHPIFSEFLVAMSSFQNVDSTNMVADASEIISQKRLRLIHGFEKTALYYYENNYFYLAALYAIKAGLKDLALRSAVNICIDIREESDYTRLSDLIGQLRELGAGVETDFNFKFLCSIQLIRQHKYMEVLKLLSDILEPLRIQPNKQFYLIAIKLLSIANRNVISIESGIDLVNREEIFFKDFKAEMIFDIVAEQIKNYLFIDDITAAESLLNKNYHKAIAEGDILTALSLKSFYITIHFSKGEYKKGFAVYNSLSDVDPIIQENIEKTMARMTIAKYFQSSGNFNESIRLIEQDIKMKEQYGMPDELFVTYATAVDIYVSACPEYFNTAIDYLKIMMDYSLKNRQNKFFNSYTMLYRIILKVLYQEYSSSKLIASITSDAEECIDINPEEALENLYPFVEILASAYISCLYINQGNLDHAMRICQNSLQTTQNSGIKTAQLLLEGLSFCIDLMQTDIGMKPSVSAESLHKKIHDFLKFCENQNVLNIFKRMPVLKRLLKLGNEKNLCRSFCSQALAYVGDKVARFAVKSFGEFNLYDIQCNNQLLKFETNKSKELFALFVANSDRYLNRNYILEKLWPDTTQSKAISHLHLSIHQLRKMFASLGFSNLITYKSNHYIFDFESLDIDIVKFCSPLIETLSDELMIEDLEKRCNLYKGLFMLDFGWEGLETMATHYEILYTSYLTKLAELYKKLRDPIALSQINNRLDEISSQFL